jgi:hypothetical protein
VRWEVFSEFMLRVVLALVITQLAIFISLGARRQFPLFYRNLVGLLFLTSRPSTFNILELKDGIP